MSAIGIGIVGGGYMGKAHAVAMAAVGAVFETPLRPRLETVCGSTAASSERLRERFGFARAAPDWEALVADPAVEAVVIASPPHTHRAIALAAIGRGKPVFCEKPMGATLAEAEEMTEAAERAGVVNMIGFNYVRTPATRFAHQLIEAGRIGEVTFLRGEHTEDFLADPHAPATWRCQGFANGTMGDLAPHMVNCARALLGPIATVSAAVETVHAERGGEAVTNDDQGQMMVRFRGAGGAPGPMGHLFFSRVATGRKMGYAYEVFGTKGAIRFDGEDQNALHLYLAEGPEAERGFTKILTGPAHPDYEPFCQGPGHGTGYQDQITIEARDFLRAVHSGRAEWPTFREGLEVWRTLDAAMRSAETGHWTAVAQTEDEGA